MQTYGRVNDFKLLDVKIICNDQKILYEGKVDDAPIYIKEMFYSKVVLGKITEIYIYDENQS